MKEDDGLPTTTIVTKKESSDSSIFGKGRYMFWALAAILLLAFWSMFTGTVTLRWSAGYLNRLSYDLDSPIHGYLDALEMEEREKAVKHMWDVYTNSRRIRLPRFWQEAFEAAYDELSSDVAEVRDAAIGEIAKMSVRSVVNIDPPSSIQRVAVNLVKSLKLAESGKTLLTSTVYWDREEHRGSEFLSMKLLLLTSMRPRHRRAPILKLYHLFPHSCPKHSTLPGPLHDVEDPFHPLEPARFSSGPPSLSPANSPTSVSSHTYVHKRK